MGRTGRKDGEARVSKLILGGEDFWILDRATDEEDY